MKVINLVILIAILSFNFSCRNANEGQQVVENTLNLSLNSEIATLDPANSYDTVSAEVVYQVYEPLYSYHYLKRPYTIIPQLAEDLPKVENGGTKYTIKIKKNIQYHDNIAFNNQKRFLTAHDFVTQIKRLAYLPTKSNGWWLFDQKVKGLNKFRDTVQNDFNLFKSYKVEGLYALDDSTLVIELTKPYPQLLYALAMSFTAPMPIEVVEYYRNDLSKVMVGTGPFTLSKYEMNHSIFLTKFANFRDEFYPNQGDRFSNENNLMVDAGKKIPFLNAIKFSIIKESQTRWLNFLSSKLDILSIPKDNFGQAITPSGELTEELRSKKIQLQISPTLIYWWLAFNMKEPLFGQNKKLRYAIAHAINIDKFIEIFTNNVAQKANSIYPPGVFGYSPSTQLNFDYNLDRAKAYLAEAGYPDGKNLPTLNFDVRGDNTTSRQMGDFVKTELEKINIKVNVVLNTFPAFLEKSRNGKLQFWQDGWALDYPDVENILQLLSNKNFGPGPNTTYYNNPLFEEKFTKLISLSDSPEKLKLIEEVEKIVSDDMPWVMEYYSRDYILYNNRLKNFRYSDLIFNYLKYLKIN